MQNILTRINELIEPAVAALGYELWGCELSSGGHQSLLRVYIDSEKGVSIEDCEAASKQIGSLLDVEDVFHNAYFLEVSSPGMDRLLFKLAHYQRYIGQQIQVKLYTPVHEQRNFKGMLEAVTESGAITLRTGEEVITFAFTDIEKARLLPSFKAGK